MRFGDMSVGVCVILVTEVSVTLMWDVVMWWLDVADVTVSFL